MDYKTFIHERIIFRLKCHYVLIIIIVKNQLRKIHSLVLSDQNKKKINRM